MNTDRFEDENPRTSNVTSQSTHVTDEDRGTTYSSECQSNHSKDPFHLSDNEEDSSDIYRPVIKKRCIAVLANDLNLNVSEIAVKKTPRVAYVHSQDLLTKANELIRIEGRAELVHSLIRTYGLLQYLQVVTPRPATQSEILAFHSSDYIQCLQDISAVSDSEDIEEQHKHEVESYGLSYDCPLQKDLLETASLISGASQAASQHIINGLADIVINWYGGWHHAKRDTASGFCYINDVVLCILKLRQQFDKVLYVDIDLHHGDGVEEAFATTSKVMTVSFHKLAPGFYPGSGELNDVGTGRGKYFTVNIPLMDGIKDKEYFSIFTKVMKQVKDRFLPDAIVMQCGADTLSEDPMTSFNLTHFGIAKCVCYMLTWNLPTVLLGGGGYHFPNTAKCWTFLTALAAGKKLPVDIPEHEHFLDYGPSYELTTSPGNKRDLNTDQYLANIVSTIEKNLNNVSLS
uniref:Histone deacetylase n=1 Tax=Biomphalaria glabrata TaxID=6526 RepID=A0A2C9JYC4_BIOGL